MHIALISGSHRKDSQSERVAKYLTNRLKGLDAESTAEIISLAGNPLPLWDESAWQPDGALAKQWQPYSEKLQKADGLVIISPEWHGMVPSGLKNFFLFCSTAETGHKPALIVTVSASKGGVHPVNELRISGYKNSRICYLPEHLIVQDVNNRFVGDAPSGADDEYIRNRADYALTLLLKYTKTLKPLLNDAALFDKRFPFGM